MAHATDVVGWAYEADVHCTGCAETRFPQIRNDEGATAVDAEGNEVTPIFNGEDAYEDCGSCGGSGSHVCDCKVCGAEVLHDCETCGDTGKVSRCCGDCGEELVS